MRTQRLRTWWDQIISLWLESGFDQGLLFDHSFNGTPGTHADCPLL